MLFGLIQRTWSQVSYFETAVPACSYEFENQAQIALLVLSKQQSTISYIFHVELVSVGLQAELSFLCQISNFAKTSESRAKIVSDVLPKSGRVPHVRIENWNAIYYHDIELYVLPTTLALNHLSYSRNGGQPRETVARSNFVIGHGLDKRN